MFVYKFRHSGLVRYWVSYRNGIGSYGCYSDKDYAIEMCNCIEGTTNWNQWDDYWALE